jgi:tRNA dimethylallyltransferase
MARAPHRLYGVSPAAEASSVAMWREAALAEIALAHESGKRAIVAGGTGLYLNALIHGLSPVPQADADARARATALYSDIGGAAFRDALRQRDPEAAARLEPGDRQRLIRAWEVAESTGISLSEWRRLPRDPGHALQFQLIGLAPPRPALYGRIDRRFEAMLDCGALDEAARFEALNLPPDLPANKALGLAELRRCLKGELDLAEASRIARQATRNYAKRQSTWFRHQMPGQGVTENPHISHAVFAELSESFLAEIIAFIVRSG